VHADAPGPWLVVDTTDGEWTYPLVTGGEAYHERVRWTLEHVFTLDCLVRIERTSNVVIPTVFAVPVGFGVRGHAAGGRRLAPPGRPHSRSAS
jgi:hypothetical protein